jgi:hypothetical protein
VNAERKLVNICTLAAEIEDSDLWVWDTTVEAGLWVRLQVQLSVSILHIFCNISHVFFSPSSQNIYRDVVWRLISNPH